MSLAAPEQWECVPAPDGKGWRCGAAGTVELKAGPPSLKPPPADGPTPAKPPQERGITTPPPAKPEAAAPASQPEPLPPKPPVAKPEPKPLEPPAVSPKRGSEETRAAEPEQTAAEAESPAPDDEQPAEKPPAQPAGPAEQTASPPATNHFTVLLDEGIAWEQCQAVPAVARQSPANGLIVIEADSATALPEQNTAEFQGNVVIHHPKQTVYADKLHFDNQRQLIKADQQLLIQLRDLRLLGSQAWFDLNRHKGEMSQVSYRIPSRKARGEAGRMALLDKDHSRFENISYTTCPPGNRGFVLSAESMDIDQKNQIGTFRAAKLRFLGVPIFYAPTLTVSLDDSRKSGLLVPSLGYSSKNGADITVPYYFNLAPNYDATFMPRLLSKRGLLLGGEFRFLTPSHSGRLLAEILPDDRLYEGNSTRGALRARTHSNLGQITPGLAADLDLNWVSDQGYLDDLGQSLAVTSTRHLRNRAALSWRNRNWDAVAELRHYRTLDDSILPEDRPYSLLPRMAVHWLQYQGPAGLDYSLAGEVSNFYREDSVTGLRVDLKPRISLPWRRDWGFIEPALNARYTSYSLDGQLPGQSSSPSRSTYSISLDSGLMFDRDVTWFGRNMTHTLEPRAYYLYTPYKKQSDIPLFDTSYLDFNFSNLFHDNRFNGPDRVGDANQLTLALTSRVLSGSDGRELLNASIGQIYYFEDRRVTLLDDEPIDTSSSSVIAELTTGIFDHWLLRAGVQVDTHADTRVQQGLAQASYGGDSGERLHASWRLREGTLEQTDLAAYWPVSNKIGLIGRWYYSVEERHDLETVAGIEYGDCCWRIRAVWRRYLDSNGTEYNNTALLQLELNGLGKLGNNIDNFLDRTIYGY
ncbi:LPS assembly protein LptD [Thiolapillus sp.]|uniref:LPS-assembly protein LptD n=1 Tax=Thiolapillus sp. TaxID=2017437 RepID=UPI003AF93068